MCRYREDAFPGIEGILPSCKGKTPEQEPLTCRQGPETDAQRRLRNGPAFRHGVVDAEPLRHLVADRPDGVETRHRVLEDHADTGSTHPGHLRVVQLQQIPPLEHDLPSRDVSRRRRDETQDTAAQHRLPAAGLADDAERPALRDRERHRDVGEDGGIAQPKLGHQPAYVEDGAPGRGGTGRHGARRVAACFAARARAHGSP